MPLNPGVLILTFNPPGNFVVDRLHTVPASEGLASFSQGGCAIQAATVKDKVENTAYAEATDKVYTPHNSSTGSVRAEWDVVLHGTKFRVLGAHNTHDAWGRAYQCEFIVKKEAG